MKTKFLIIVVVIISIIISGPLTELFYQIALCETTSQFFDQLPEMNMLECLQFLSSPDPYSPHGKPSIDYDFSFHLLLMFKTIVIVAVPAGLVVFIIYRRKK